MTDWPIFNLSLSLFIPWIAGYSLLLVLLKPSSNQEFFFRTALAYALGMGILTYTMLILGCLRIPLSLSSIGYSLVVLTTIFLLIFLLGKKNSADLLFTPKPENTPNPLLFFLMAGCVGYFTIYVFWRSLNIPVIDWDAVSIWAFNAKVFFYDQTLDHAKYIPHASYPLHVCFAEAWIALNLGSWNDVLIKIIFPFEFLSYLIIQYHILKLYTNKTWAMLGNVLLVSSNFFIYHATIGYADFTLMYYNSLVILLLLLWNRESNKKYLFLAGLLSGLMTFVKIEGLIYLMIHTVLAFYILSLKNSNLLNKIKDMSRFVIPSYLLYSFYFLFKIKNDIPLLRDDAKITFHLDQLHRVPVILEQFLNNLFYSGNWNILWLLFVLSLIRYPQRKKISEIRILIFGLLLFFLAHFLLFLLTPSFSFIASFNQESSVLSRLFLHFFPLIPLLIIFLNAPFNSPTHLRE